VIDVDTFLTALYVMVDNFCQSLTQKERPRPGPDASLILARLLHSPSSPAGAASLVSGISTVTQTPTAQRLSNPAQPLAIQPVGAASVGAHRGHRFAFGDAFGRSEMSLRSLGQVRDAG